MLGSERTQLGWTLFVRYNQEVFLNEVIWAKFNQQITTQIV